MAVVMADMLLPAQTARLSSPLPATGSSRDGRSGVRESGNVSLPLRQLQNGWFGSAVRSRHITSVKEQRCKELAVRRLVARAQEVPLTVAQPATSASSNGATTVGLTTPSKPSVPEIEFKCLDTPPMDFKGDLLLIGVFQDALDDANNFVDPALKEVDTALAGLLSEVAAEEEFKAKPGQTVIVRLQGQGVKRIGLAGLGKKENASSAGAWKGVGGVLATAAKQAKAVTAALGVIGASDLAHATAAAAAGFVSEGVLLGAFEDSRFKAEVKPPSLQSVAILGLGSSAEISEAIGRAVRVAAGIILTKQLVNAPANVLTPCALAEVAEAIAFAHSDVMTATILDEKECEQLGMGAYLGVSAASTNPPRFIHLKYTPEGPVETKLAVIGKGLTFDSGGYNIKAGPGSMIELMKFDMGGAGATLGAAKAIGALQPPGVEVHFIVAACENMISGTGMRPGDILTASNGRTIEVNNTDAEGRLTLADALVYACKLGPNKIVDMATLTGACIIALGNDIAGMFTPNDSMSEELDAASKAAGEKLWRMPMEEGYGEMLKSNIADTVNTGGRPGGSITAALFLKEFVDKEIPWAHLDIAGPVWSEKKGGGTGFGVATMVQWITAHAKVTA